MPLWYTYPLDSAGGGYGEIPEPLNNAYLKPDTNIRVPSGTPISTWDSGIITDVSNRGYSAGGLSVTQKLDHPPNGSVLYASFNYLGSNSVHVGQVVSPGTQIGIAGSPTGVNFALALGNTPVWGTGTFPQGKGDPNFDPRIILNPLRNGTPLPNGSGGTSLGNFNISLSTLSSVSDSAHQILNNIPGFVGIVNAVDKIEQFVPFSIQDASGKTTGIIGNPFWAGVSAGSGISNSNGILPLPANAIQATLTFITANTLAAVVRLIIVLVGIVMLMALIMNAVGTGVEEVTGQTPGQIASTAIRIGALAG